MIKINGVEILTILDGMTWSGSKEEGPRSLSFDFLYKPLNEDVPKYSVAVGDNVIWEEEGKILFQGYIENLGYNTDNDKISVSCKDLMARLMRSKFVGRMKGTFSQLANKICGIFNITCGINVDNTHVHNIISTGDLTYYQVLETALNSMYKRYALYMDGTTLKLADSTSQATFKIGLSIRSSNFTQDIQNLVTKVLIIDNEGHIIASRQNNELLQKFGLFQEVYNYNKDSKNNLADADRIISDSVSQKGTIVVNNDNNCIAGRVIEVDEPVNNFRGTFEILGDTHTIGADSYMQLEIKLIG